jgi:hypothetical protein
MKKIFAIITICIALNHATFAQPKKMADLSGTSVAPKRLSDLTGRWIITGEQDASLQIIDSTTFLLTYMGEKKKLSNVQVDFSKNPAWLDFTTTDSTSQVQVKTLFEILNDNTIKWQWFIDEDRPDHFSSTKGEMFYLRKERNTSAVVSN